MKDDNIPSVPWSGRGSRYTDDEIAYVVEAMREADPLTQGRFQAEFEAAFRDYAGADHAFATSSCSSALELTALISRVGLGDEVILPAHTFAATAIPFARTGARLVWADIEPDSLVVSAATLAPLINERTRVIVVVHLYGLAADMDPILALAAEHGILVVEDTAQALGARYKGRRVGTLGDFGCFSFHTHKNISTLGEGGMLVVKDAERAALAPGLRHHGMRGFDGERDHYWLPAMSNVDVDMDGVWPIKVCLGEPQCAAGTMMLKRVDAVNERRRARAQRMIEALAGYDEIAFQTTPADSENVYYCIPARYDGPGNGHGRDDFMERMAFYHRVRMAVQYCPLYRYPLFQKAGFGDADCPETDRFYDAMVSFPPQEWMPDDQFDYMIEAARETLDFLRG